MSPHLVNDIVHEGTLTSIDSIFDLLAVGDRGVDDPTRAVGERVGLLAHALQCADRLAERFPNDVELQVAGLVHDIAHHVPLTGWRPRTTDHEHAHGRQGAALVGPLLGERVATLVELHVPAKRFLVTVDHTYADILSSVSTQTLMLQGGPMSEEEAQRFIARPDAAAAVHLRRADDDAKSPGAESSTLEHWRPMLEALAAAR